MTLEILPDKGFKLNSEFFFGVTKENRLDKN